jgi:hypothetical protein
VPQTWIELPFADGKYLFKLGLAQIEEIEGKASKDAGAPVGIGRVYARTRAGRYGFEPSQALPESGEYRWPELVEVIRQGLIGGGMGWVNGAEVKVSTPRANELVDRYLLQATNQRLAMTDVWALAFAVMHALIEGYTPPGEVGAGENPAT